MYPEIIVFQPVCMPKEAKFVVSVQKSAVGVSTWQ
jgi:hypothetical protein